MYTLEKKKANIRELEKKQKLVEQRIPKIQQIEVDLGLPDNVQDSELTEVTKAMQQSLASANAAIRAQAIKEAEAEEAKKPKPVFEIIPVNE